MENFCEQKTKKMPILFIAIVLSFLLLLPAIFAKDLINKDDKFLNYRDGNWIASNKINRVYIDNNSNTAYIGLNVGSSSSLRRIGRYSFATNITTDLTNRTSAKQFQQLDIEAFAFDYVNNKIYISGEYVGSVPKGQLWMYDKLTDTLHNLTSTAAGNSNVFFNVTQSALAYDPKTNVLYMTTGSITNNFAVYNISANTTALIPSNYTGFNSLAYDTNHSVLFLGGVFGNFAKYNLTDNTTTNLTGTVPSGYTTSSVQTVVWAPESSNLVFLGWTNKKLTVYNITSNTMYDYSAWLPNIGNSDSLDHLAIDRNYASGSPNLYFAAESSGTKTPKLFLFNFTGNSTINYTGTLVNAGWTSSGTDIEDIAYDFAEKTLMIAGGTGQLFSYNFTANTALDLSGTDESPWHGYANSIYFTMVNVSNTAYFVTDAMVGGTENSARFGMYNFTSDTVTRLPIPSTASRGGGGITFISPDRILIGGRGTSMLMYNITLNQTFNVGSILGSAFGFSDIIQAFAYDSSRNLLYFGIDDTSNGGKFGVYNISANTTARLSLASSGVVRAVAYDSSRNLVYIGNSNGNLNVYNFTSNSTSNVGAPPGNAGIWSLQYDPNKQIVYGTANSGNYWAYNFTSAAYSNFSGTDAGDFVGTNSITSSTFGQTTNEVYIGGDAVFAVYNATTNITYDYSANDTNDWIGADRVVSMAYHSPTDTVLVSTTNSRIGILTTTGISMNVVSPTTSANYSATQYATFIYNVSITCSSSNCNNVTAYPLSDGSALSTIAGATPFFTSSTLLYQCGVLTSGQTCYASWTINATGPTTQRSNLTVFANSSDTSVTSATSNKLNVYYDPDGDNIPDNLDNCPTVSNADQADWDSDGIGNLCDIYYNATGTAYNPTARGGNGGSSKTRIHFFIEGLGGTALLNSTSGNQINVSVINHDTNGALQCSRLMPLGIYRIGDELSTADSCSFTNNGNYSLRIYSPTTSATAFTFRLDAGKFR